MIHRGFSLASPLYSGSFASSSRGYLGRELALIRATKCRNVVLDTFRQRGLLEICPLRIPSSGCFIKRAKINSRGLFARSVREDKSVPIQLAHVLRLRRGISP